MATPSAAGPVAPPVTLLITRRIRAERYADFLRWIHRGEELARHFPGYLGSGVLAPPEGGADYQIVFRFADEATLAAWADSPERQHWLAEGADLVDDATTELASGLDGWFGNHAPPRWKQAITIWIVFFPVSVIFALLTGDLLNHLPVVLRILVSTAAMTPIMVFFFIPLATRLLRPWLKPARRGGRLARGSAVGRTVRGT